MEVTVRKLKAKQKYKCSWCGENASHRGYMFGKAACGDHLEKLQKWDTKAQAPDYSEAAFQLRY